MDADSLALIVGFSIQNAPPELGARMPKQVKFPGRVQFQ